MYNEDDAVAKLDGYVVSVLGAATLVGEKTLVRIDKVGRSAAEASLVNPPEGAAPTDQSSAGARRPARTAGRAPPRPPRGRGRRKRRRRSGAALSPPDGRGIFGRGLLRRGRGSCLPHPRLGRFSSLISEESQHPSVPAFASTRPTEVRLLVAAGQRVDGPGGRPGGPFGADQGSGAGARRSLYRDELRDGRAARGRPVARPPRSSCTGLADPARPAGPRRRRSGRRQAPRRSAIAGRAALSRPGGRDLATSAGNARRRPHGCRRDRVRQIRSDERCCAHAPPRASIRREPSTAGGAFAAHPRPRAPREPSRRRGRGHRLVGNRRMRHVADQQAI